MGGEIAFNKRTETLREFVDGVDAIDIQIVLIQDGKQLCVYATKQPRKYNFDGRWSTVQFGDIGLPLDAEVDVWSSQAVVGRPDRWEEQALFDFDGASINLRKEWIVSTTP